MPLYEGILDALALAPGSTLLDAGCGSGIVSFLAEQRGLCVTGLDVSPKFIEAARRRVLGVEFTVGDLQQLPFQSDTLDAVVGCNSFQFAAHPSAAAASLPSRFSTFRKSVMRYNRLRQSIRCSDRTRQGCRRLSHSRTRKNFKPLYAITAWPTRPFITSIRQWSTRIWR